MIYMDLNGLADQRLSGMRWRQYSLCSNVLRDMPGDDIVGRLGGDEFPILLPRTDNEGAEKYRKGYLLSKLTQAPGTLSMVDLQLNRRGPKYL